MDTGMDMRMSTIETIKKNLADMTKSERQAADCFLKDPAPFLFSTLDETAKLIGISTTSVLRFCRKLGFDGYKQFQIQIREEVHHFPSLTDKFKRRASSESTYAPETLLAGSLNCIEKTFSELDSQAFSKAVSLLSEASKVFSFGMKESYALSHYAFTRLQTVRKNVYFCDTLHQGQVENLLNMGKGDVCIFFLFPRYTRQSLNVLNAMEKRDVTVLLVTDPLWQRSSDQLVLLPCYVDAGGIKNSAAAPVLLLDQLCNALTAAIGEDALTHMKDAEELFYALDILE